MAKKSSKSGLKRPEAPVDLFTLQPEPDLVDEAQEEQEEKESDTPKADRAEPESEKPSAKETKKDALASKPKNIHVSTYLPQELLVRLDELKYTERERLQEENKRATRSTLIREAIELYLQAMEE